MSKQENLRAKVRNTLRREGIPFALLDWVSDEYLLELDNFGHASLALVRGGLDEEWYDAGDELGHYFAVSLIADVVAAENRVRDLEEALVVARASLESARARLAQCPSLPEPTP